MFKISCFQTWLTYSQKTSYTKLNLKRSFVYKITRTIHTNLIILKFKKYIPTHRNWRSTYVSKFTIPQNVSSFKIPEVIKEKKKYPESKSLQNSKGQKKVSKLKKYPSKQNQIVSKFKTSPKSTHFEIIKVAKLKKSLNSRSL